MKGDLLEHRTEYVYYLQSTLLLRFYRPCRHQRYPRSRLESSVARSPRHAYAARVEDSDYVEDLFYSILYSLTSC